MGLWQDLLLVSLIGGVVALDTTAAWQTMISQPLVACLGVGILLGNPSLGFTVGILMELPWLLEIPAGGTRLPEGNLGSVVSSATVIYLVQHQYNKESIALVLSIFAGVLVSSIAGRLVNQMRTYNKKLIQQADEAAKSGNLQQISLLNMKGLVYSFCLGFFVVGFSFYVAVVCLSYAIKLFPSTWEEAFHLGKIALLGVGCGCLMAMLLKDINWKYFILFVGVSFVVIMGYVIF